MTPRPPKAKLEPIVCPVCLAERKATLMWIEQPTQIFCCESHGTVFTREHFDALMIGR